MDLKDKSLRWWTWLIWLRTGSSYQVLWTPHWTVAFHEEENFGSGGGAIRLWRALLHWVTSLSRSYGHDSDTVSDTQILPRCYESVVNFRKGKTIGYWNISILNGIITDVPPSQIDMHGGCRTGYVGRRRVHFRPTNHEAKICCSLRRPVPNRDKLWDWQNSVISLQGIYSYVPLQLPLLIVLVVRYKTHTTNQLTL
jgi:hypothetical protein